MITALEYIVEPNGCRCSIFADKNVAQKNAWHLKTLGGNGLPPISALGAASYGLPGKSYQGITVDAREIEAELYADGYSIAGLQDMLDSVPRMLSGGHEGLGLLRLRNSAGKWARIGAKCIEFEEDERYRRTSLFGAVFDCPQPYFEDDLETVLPFTAVDGGKEYPLDRPYLFGDIEGGTIGIDGLIVHEVEAYNAGDIECPCIINIYGEAIKALTITNQTTGKEITLQADAGLGRIEINTDPDNLYCLTDDEQDASAYVSLFNSISDFTLAPGANQLYIEIQATRETLAGTAIRFRGRYSAWL